MISNGGQTPMEGLSQLEVSDERKKDAAAALRGLELLSEIGDTSSQFNLAFVLQHSPPAVQGQEPASQFLPERNVSRAIQLYSRCKSSPHALLQLAHLAYGGNHVDAVGSMSEAARYYEEAFFMDKRLSTAGLSASWMRQRGLGRVQNWTAALELYDETLDVMVHPHKALTKVELQTQPNLTVWILKDKRTGVVHSEDQPWVTRVPVILARAFLLFEMWVFEITGFSCGSDCWHVRINAN
jgi:hypothetical protein